ncbi:MAG: hypothetical protein WBP79_17240 [Candidatus Acidiferrales bacterium]
MKLFDTVERENLDRRELQLLILAMACIVLLAAGLALIAYPVIFSHALIVSSTTLKVCFFGFCLLCVLLVGYLWERHQVVRRLRHQIEFEQRRYAEFRFQTGRDLLAALPGFNQFQDRLVMEYRRSANLSEAFSVLVVKLTPAVNIADLSEVTAAVGDAVKAITHRLRREDSLYHFTPDAFAIIQPGTKTADSRHIAGRIEEGLLDASGAANRFSAVVKVFNFPEHAATAHELEMSVRSMLPADLISEPAVESRSPAIAEREA